MLVIIHDVILFVKIVKDTGVDEKKDKTNSAKF